MAHQLQGPGHRLHRQLHDRRQNDAEVSQDGRWGLDLGLGPGHLGHELDHREQHLLGRTIPAKLAAATTLSATRSLPYTRRARPMARRRIRSV